MSDAEAGSEDSFWSAMLNRGIGKQRSYKYFLLVFFLIIALELVGTFGIIRYVPYTNIDWDAYMEEVEGVVNGTYDYTLLKGDTGPLVYPAGFVYLFTGLYFLTDRGSDVRLAQYVWLALYVVTLAVMLVLYRKGGRVPLWALVLLSCSRRIHSIFVLRLFNDCWAVFLSVAAFALFVSDFWTLGCFLFSLAVSVKMNILLFAPGLLLLLLKRFGAWRAIPRLLFACAAPQVFLGAPFLYANWFGYLQRSFDLGRQFFYVWSVNWQFVPEALFLNRWFGLTLLALTASTCVLFALFKWTSPDEHFADILAGHFADHKRGRLTADHILTTLFTSNFIGIALARSLHFQFYVWYFFTLPYLLWATAYPTPIRVALLFAIEIVWNIFPANAYASAVLCFAHLAILAGLVATPLPNAYTKETNQKERIGRETTTNTPRRSARNKVKVL